ncbi:MAG: AMP-binding protein, partial [Myxococcota bacterium]
MRQLIDNSGATALPNPIESSAIARPQEPVLLTDEGTWTARELRDAVRRCAAALVAGGVEPRTRVGLIGPPSAEWVIASHAIGWLGGSVTPLPHDQPVAEIEKAVAVANPAAVVVTHGHDKSDLQTLERLASGRLFEMRALTGGNSEDLTERFWPWDEERATLLTSGTTGVSQPISLSTSQIVMSAFGSTIRLGHQPDDRWLACLPLNHVGGFQIMMRAALEATSVVLHPRFVATRVAKALDSGDITLVSLVPTMLERVLEVRGDVPFPDTLRAILVGGAGISAELMERCRVARAPVSLTWGMTEAASQITTRYPGELSADGGSGAP